MWFSWLLFVLVWRKIKPMMCLAHVRVCGTEIGYRVFFQASLNKAGTEIAARSFLLKIHQHPFILSAFTSAVSLDCGDSWQILEGKALMGLVMLMERGFPEPYCSFISLDGGFLFVKANAHLMPWFSYLEPLTVQFSREEHSHFFTVNHILLLKILLLGCLVFFNWKHAFKFHYRAPVT